MLFNLKNMFVVCEQLFSRNNDEESDDSKKHNMGRVENKVTFFIKKTDKCLVSEKSVHSPESTNSAGLEKEHCTKKKKIR